MQEIINLALVPEKLFIHAEHAEICIRPYANISISYAQQQQQQQQNYAIHQREHLDSRRKECVVLGFITTITVQPIDSIEYC